MIASEPALVFAAIKNDRRVAALGQRFYNPRADAALRAGDEISLRHLWRAALTPQCQNRER